MMTHLGHTHTQQQQQHGKKKLSLKTATELGVFFGFFFLKTSTMSEISPPPLVCHDAPNKLRLYGGKVVWGFFGFFSAVKIKTILVVWCVWASQ